MKIYKYQILTVLVFFGILFSGCSSLMMLAQGPVESFQGHETIALETARTDILDVIAKVGKSMNYSVTGLDRQSNQISLTERSGIEQGFTGSGHETTLLFNIIDSGKTIDIKIHVAGNSGKGNMNESDRIVKEFKAKISEQLK